MRLLTTAKENEPRTEGESSEVDLKVKIRGPESIPGYPGNEGPTDIRKKYVMKQSYTWHMAGGPGGIWEEFDGQTTSEATDGENLWIKG